MAYIKKSLLRTADDPRKLRKSIDRLLKGPNQDIVAHVFIDTTTGESIKQETVCDFLNIITQLLVLYRLFKDRQQEAEHS